MSAKLEKQIADLARQVAAMQTGSRNQSRGRSKSRGGLRVRYRSQSRKGPKQQRAKTPVAPKTTPSMSFNAGHARIAKRELLVSLKTGDSENATLALVLNPTSVSSEAGYVKTMASIFDEMKWNKLSLHWIPAVGNTVGGLISFGIDWDSKTVDAAAVKQGTVTALTPSISGKLNQERTMSVPAKKYQRQTWLSHHSTTSEGVLGSLVAYASGPKNTTLGMFEISYDIEFQGTRLP